MRPEQRDAEQVHGGLQQPDADDHADDEVGDRLAGDDLPRRQRTDAQQLEQPELAIAHERQGGERQREVLQQQGEGGRGEEVDRLDVGRHDVLRARLERAHQDGRVERGDLRARSAATVASVVARLAARSATSSPPAAMASASASPARGRRASSAAAGRRTAPSSRSTLSDEASSARAPPAASDTCRAASAVPASSPAATAEATSRPPHATLEISWSSGRNAAWPPPTTALTTRALTSWTARREAISTAVCWIGSSLSWSTTTSAGLPASTWRAGRPGRRRRRRRRRAEVATGLGLVGGEAGRFDEALEDVLVLVDGVLVERPGRADELGRIRRSSFWYPAPNSSSSANGPTTSSASSRGWRTISTSSLRTNAELWTTRAHGRRARNRAGRRLTPDLDRRLLARRARPPRRGGAR